MGIFNNMRGISLCKKLMLGSFFVVSAAGCGPIKSTSYLIEAETTLSAARVAGAEERAPYEWTAAQLYIPKAKEEVGYSDFQQGVDYAKRALDFAVRARDKALQAPYTPAPTASP